jgi:hypothetical protein
LLEKYKIPMPDKDCPMPRSGSTSPISMGRFGVRVRHLSRRQMAAKYDDAVIRQAAVRQTTVVSCDVEGRIAPERLRAAAAKASGVDGASVRISTALAAMSFALDTRVQSAQSAVDQITGALQGRGRVTWLRNLKPAARRGSQD